MADFSLDSYLELRNMSLPAVRSRFAIRDEQIEEQVRYEKLGPATRLHNPEVDPAAFYFVEQQLALIYLNGAALSGVTPIELGQRLGEAGSQLRSRAGKRATLSVYPEQGVAFSAQNERVDFIEIFQSMTLEQYKEQVYREPGRFSE